MASLAFFPWLDCDQAKSFGPVRLIPYERGELPGRRSHVSQTAIDAVLNAYANPPDERVQSATLLEVDEWKLGQNIDEQTLQRLSRAREAMCFAALSERRLFCNGNYCNSDNFQLIVKPLSDSDSETIVYATRRRDGGTLNSWSSDEFTFVCPRHVHRDRIEINDRIVGLIMQTENKAWIDAIVEFNAANTDADGVAPYTEMIMTKSSFERLFDINHDVIEFRKAIKSVLSVSDRSACEAEVELVGHWQTRWPKSTDLLDAWASEFCALRGTVAHGKKSGSQSFVWSEHSHLAFASLLFPLAFKVLAHKAGQLALTKEDQARITVLNSYIAHNPFKPQQSVADRAKHPWYLIEKKITRASC